MHSLFQKQKQLWLIQLFKNESEAVFSILSDYTFIVRWRPLLFTVVKFSDCLAWSEVSLSGRWAVFFYKRSGYLGHLLMPGSVYMESFSKNLKCRKRWLWVSLDLMMHSRSSLHGCWLLWCTWNIWWVLFHPNLSFLHLIQLHYRHHVWIIRHAPLCALSFKLGLFKNKWEKDIMCSWFHKQIEDFREQTLYRP